MTDTITLGEKGEVDFGQGRLLEAQLALRSVLGRVEKEGYSGSRLRAGELLAEFQDADAAAKHYSKALVEFAQVLGAVVRVGDGHDFVFADEAKSPHGVAPFELLAVHGSVPGGAMIGKQRGAAQIIEAGAELLRVLLGTAVVAAFEDAVSDERVVCLFREAPELGGRVDLATQKMTGLARVRAIVFCEREPRASYILGSCLGQRKQRQFVYEFPLVEQIYGPNRLRWCDMRSPGCEPQAGDGEAAPKVQVAS